MVQFSVTSRPRDESVPYNRGESGSGSVPGFGPRFDTDPARPGTDEDVRTWAGLEAVPSEESLLLVDRRTVVTRAVFRTRSSVRG